MALHTRHRGVFSGEFVRRAIVGELGRRRPPSCSMTLVALLRKLATVNVAVTRCAIGGEAEIRSLLDFRGLGCDVDVLDLQRFMAFHAFHRSMFAFQRVPCQRMIKRLEIEAAH